MEGTINPFDDPDALYLVLVNSEDQYSLWPMDIDIPAGWVVIDGPATRASCIAVIEARWRDMRPASLRRSLE